MKKTITSILALVLSLALMLSLAACGNNDTASTPNTDSQADTVDSTNKPSSDAKGALEVIETVWNALPEDQKFFCVGGNMNAGTAVENAPGSFGVEDAEAVDNTLGFPAASIELIDDAANLLHAMNANNFTMAAYHIIDKANLEAAVKAIDENLANRQWMCGFPEVLTIITIDDEYVVSIFGAADIVNNVKAQIAKSYTSSVVALDKDMMAEEF